MFNKRSVRMIQTLLSAVLFSLMLAFVSLAASGRINFSDPSVNAGDEVNVTMKITADEGTALSNANVMLKYPADKLEFVSGTDADGGAGSIRVHGTSNGGGTAALEYNLKFRTAAAGTFNVTIDSYEVYDGEDLPIEFTHLGNSTVTVNAPAEASANCDLNSLDVYPGTLDPAFSRQPPEAFVNDLLIGRLHARCIVAGFHYRFGYHAQGDAALLAQVCAERNVDCRIIPPVTDEHGALISSTSIRRLIAGRQYIEAEKLLGHSLRCMQPSDVTADPAEPKP